MALVYWPGYRLADLGYLPLHDPPNRQNAGNMDVFELIIAGDPSRALQKSDAGHDCLYVHSVPLRRPLLPSTLLELDEPLIRLPNRRWT